MSLSSTVQNLLNKDQDAKAVASDRDAVIEAWNGDTEAVFQSFRSALEDFVAAGTAAITEQEIDIAEETLGEYQTKRLVISIVGRNLFLSPIARPTIGGNGADRPLPGGQTGRGQADLPRPRFGRRELRPQDRGPSRPENRAGRQDFQFPEHSTRS